jgi:hypothetical protein
MFKINDILNILSDGQLHQIKGLKSEINVDDFEMEEILAFMCKFDFIEIVDNKKVKIKKSFRKFIAPRIY